MSKTVELDIGDLVVCDICDKDYTFSDEAGGFVFESKGVCPECAPRMMANIQRHGEQRFIRGRAGKGESFRAFILRIRRGGNKIRIVEKDAAE